MIENILNRLEKVRKSGSKWQARCPAHDDRSPSLTISERPNGDVGIYCHAGCDTQAVMNAIGLEMKDLFSDSLSPRDKAQYRLDSLWDEYRKADTVIAFYQSDITLNGFKSINKEGYANAISHKHSIEAEINQLKVKYKL